MLTQLKIKMDWGTVQLIDPIGRIVPKLGRILKSTVSQIWEPDPPDTLIIFAQWTMVSLPYSPKTLIEGLSIT